MTVVARATNAAAGEDWAGLYGLLHAADRHPVAPLGAAGLDALADSAWWSGHVDESVAARLRAHAAYVAAHDPRGAGRAAWELSAEYRRLGRPAAAAGWLHRARHHLEDRPDCPEQCLLAWSDIADAEEHHAPATALAAARRMTRLAARSGSPDLLALGHQAESSVLLARGPAHRAEALALLDEAMRPVTAGELSDLFTGRLYDLALGESMRAAELARTVEWTDAALAWCAAPRSQRPEAGGEPAVMAGDRPAAAPRSQRPEPGSGPAVMAGPPPLTGNPFRALFRLHHVEVLDLLGDWTRAEEEARLVYHEVLSDSLDTAAAAAYAVGEIQRRQGRLDEAARSYAHAHELGRVPQPGLALLRLAQGRADTASAGLRLALDCQSDPAHDVLGRARLLAALVETHLALGDTDAAEGAVTGLEALDPAGEVPLLAAMAAGARGAVTRAPGQLRRALALWLELRVPYEAARVRMRLAAADPAATAELTAARAAFTRLGAVPA